MGKNRKTLKISRWRTIRFAPQISEDNRAPRSDILIEVISELLYRTEPLDKALLITRQRVSHTLEQQESLSQACQRISSIPFGIEKVQGMVADKGDYLSIACVYLCVWSKGIKDSDQANTKGHESR